jgi:hypothetical protein
LDGGFRDRRGLIRGGAAGAAQCGAHLGGHDRR